MRDKEGDRFANEAAPSCRGTVETLTPSGWPASELPDSSSLPTSCQTPGLWMTMVARTPMPDRLRARYFIPLRAKVFDASCPKPASCPKGGVAPFDLLPRSDAPPA